MEVLGRPCRFRHSEPRFWEADYQVKGDRIEVSLWLRENCRDVRVMWRLQSSGGAPSVDEVPVGGLRGHLIRVKMEAELAK
jgi:hypothetical protein